MDQYRRLRVDQVQRQLRVRRHDLEHLHQVRRVKTDVHRPAVIAYRQFDLRPARRRALGLQRQLVLGEAEGDAFVSSSTMTAACRTAVSNGAAATVTLVAGFLGKICR